MRARVCVGWSETHTDYERVHMRHHSRVERGQNNRDRQMDGRTQSGSKIKITIEQSVQRKAPQSAVTMVIAQCSLRK